MIAYLVCVPSICAESLTHYTRHPFLSRKSQLARKITSGYVYSIFREQPVSKEASSNMYGVGQHL